MRHRMRITIGSGLVLLIAMSAGARGAHRESVKAGTSQEESHATSEDPNAQFNYDDYAAVLKKHVDDQGLVAYVDLKDKPEQLGRFVLALGVLDPNVYDTWDESARIAFWVNAYNGLTLKVIVDHYPIKRGVFSGLVYPANSIRQISGVWDKIKFVVTGRQMTLDDIEHGILRGENAVLVEKYGKFYEPRIHVALVCAAMSCPRLRNEPYTGDRLDGQLKDQIESFLSNTTRFRIDRAGGKVYLSSIFKWFGKDFIRQHKPDKGFDSAGGNAENSVLNFISKDVDAEQAEYLRTGEYKVRYLKYDWALNEQKDDQAVNAP